jgi:hypothetical protein
MDIIRALFSSRRPIDRTIEKVIDYYAQDEDRLATEIEEYEITDNVEAAFRKFLDVFSDAVRGGRVTEVGIWVSGFYGSGKSSFTKYLGFALDPDRSVHGKFFLDLLCDRFQRAEVPAALRTVSRRSPSAVIPLDLGAEQLAESVTAPVATVLYWKVLQWAGFSKEKKLARLELTLERLGKLDEFRRTYREQFGDEWEAIHNDPVLGVARAAGLIPQLLPSDFPTPDSFRTLRFQEAQDLRDLVREIIELCRRRTGRESILFLIDEAGQYVAPRSELILNLDGLARDIKELGQGKVWILATGQQTLTEISERAALNSAELNKLKDRFPIAIHLDASDIREITHRRLLTKSLEGESLLQQLFAAHGQALLTHTRLAGTALYRGDPDAVTFARLYPFLPQHFDLLLELIRILARSTGGVGLRSAIRVIQDVLVDKSRVLSGGTAKLADRAVGVLACVDDFYNTLRADIARVLPHVVNGVDKVVHVFANEPMALRVAKAVAALQPIETFPRTAENIAALLYPELGSASLLDDVRQALRALVDAKECGLIEDPLAGGYVFLSEVVRPLRDKRNGYVPTAGESSRVKIDILRQGTPDSPLFSVQPSARLEGTKEVKAAVKLGRSPVVGGSEEIDIALEFVDPSTWETRRGALLVETNTRLELRTTIVWLARADDAVEELLQEIVRSEKIAREIPEEQTDQDVAQFRRAERRLAERNRELVAKSIERALMDGTLVFRGKPMPASEAGATLQAAAQTSLGGAAKEVFDLYHLVPIRPSTEAAARFLTTERLDRMTRELDPLGLVIRTGSAARVHVDHPALAEVLRVIRTKIDESGSGRLQGNFLQDLFSSPRYGWSKDAVRYVFAALVTAGEIELHIPAADGPVRTPGPLAVEAMKSTVAFNRVGVALRGSRPSVEALDRAARRLEELFGGIEVLPSEDHISRAVQKHMPMVLERIGSLPDRLRLLALPGEERARNLLAAATDLLRGDANDATATLGGKDCTIPKDLQWARKVVGALDDGAETELQQASTFFGSLSELESIFPGGPDGFLSDGDRETVRNVFESDRFYEQMPDLRAVLRRLKDQMMRRYGDEREQYDRDLRAALDSLEAEPDWSRLLPEDREEIAARLRRDVPDEPDRGSPIRSLQVLLVRRTALAGHTGELHREVKRRVPPVPEPERITETEDEYAAEFVLDAATLLTPTVIRTSQDLEGWLTALREKIAAFLKEKKFVRIKSGMDQKS